MNWFFHNNNIFLRRGALLRHKLCQPDITKYDLEEVKKEHIPSGEMGEFEEWREDEKEEVIQYIAQSEVLSNAEKEDWNNDNHPHFLGF